ncbi:MAG: hypothetical protein ACRDFB_05225 [Rhabdochlamydiaceae bacterium]
MSVNKSAYRPDDAVDFVYEQLGKPLRDQLKLGRDDVEAIAKRIFGGSTALLVSPYTQKYEIKDFLDDYWDIQLKPLVYKAHPDIKGLPEGVKRA